MAIEIIDNFKAFTPKPLDDRAQKNSYAEILAIADRWQGMEVYNTDAANSGLNAAKYKLIGKVNINPLHNDNWVNQDLETKAYIDSKIDGLKWKQAVRLATTANVTLSGLQTIDGIAAGDGDRVLVKDQIDKTQNGIYTVSSSTWVRSNDANTTDELRNATTSVQIGTDNGLKDFTQSTVAPVIGTDDIVWVNKSTTITFGAITGSPADNAALQGALDDKVDKDGIKGLSTNDFDNSYKNKVDNTPLDTNAALSNKADTVHTHVISDVDGLDTQLSNKVDKDGVKQLSEENYTSAEKGKLSSLSITYLGTYTSLISLASAHPVGVAGNEAIIDAGTGAPPNKAFWDSSDNEWVLGTDPTAATFAELGGSPGDNAALLSAFNDKVDKVGGKGLSTNDFDATAKGKVDNLPGDTNAVLLTKEPATNVISITDVAYTLVLADAAKLIMLTGAAAQTITLPKDSTAAIPVNAKVIFAGNSNFAKTFAAEAGATIISVRGLLMDGYKGHVIAEKVAANTWFLSGDVIEAVSLVTTSGTVTINSQVCNRLVLDMEGKEWKKFKYIGDDAWLGIDVINRVDGSQFIVDIERSNANVINCRFVQYTELYADTQIIDGAQLLLKGKGTGRTLAKIGCHITTYSAGTNAGLVNTITYLERTNIGS